MPASATASAPSAAPPVFAPWSDEQRRHWGQRPLRLEHRLHAHAAFTPDVLAALIERYPKQSCALVMTSRQGDGTPRWREGDFAGIAGAAVVDAIARRTLWLNLREVDRHDAVYAALLRQAYDEIAAAVPGFAARALKMGILVSSPRAQVHYHCDLPGQLLWQIRGTKKVWLYPPEPPFLLPSWLEDIAYTGHEFSLVYDPAFDRHAVVFDLAPGQLLSWPLNAPHRIDNGDELSVSVTTEHWTDANRRAQKVHLANAVLRRRLGWQARSRRLDGPSYWTKAALQAAWRRTPWAARAQRALRPVDFRLAPQTPQGYVDLAGG